MSQKYNITEERLSEHDIPVMLQAIANELAEKNRLKRLQLYAEGKLETTDMEDLDVGKDRIKSGSKLGVRP